MGKRKRGPSTKSTEPASEYQDRKANKLAIKSYEDVGDSEDEFMAHRDQVLLDGGPNAKKRKQVQEDAIELSDEEVLGYSDSDDDQEADLVDGEDHEDETSEDSAGASEEEDFDTRGWGPNKKDYYNADAIETEQDALDEEAEARRIQQRQRKALTEADFAFDEDEWAEAGKDEDVQRETGGVVTEVLPQLQIREDMSDAEKLKLLKSRYPEFEPLSKEFMRLQPVCQALAQEVARTQGNPGAAGAVIHMKYRALSGYMGSLAMYFALLTSTATTDKSKSLPMPATELRGHDIISSLEQFQRLWAAVEDLEPDEELELRGDDQLVNFTDLESEEDVTSTTEAPPEVQIPTPTSVTKAAGDDDLAASKARRAVRLANTEASLAQLSDLSTLARRRAPITAPPNDADADTDLGDEQPLTTHESAEKARKRKSLRFYTSQLAQKSNKRASAGRAAGGDDDVPHRERLRDRAERLNKEAERRGRKGDVGDDLGREDDDEQQEVTNLQREEQDDDVDAGETALLKRMHAKRASKSAKEAAYAQAKFEGGRVVPRINPNAVGPDGRREIGYAIEKNKGLTPKRAKANKNPRVKKRLKFEEKSKKLRSMKPMFKGGEAKGGYGGELTGIKRNLVRSVKL